MDRLQEQEPANHRNDQLLQIILDQHIALVNQTAVPASQHGYGIAAMDNDRSIASNSESLTNYGAVYAATQESMKSQATTMAAMQG